MQWTLLAGVVATIFLTIPGDATQLAALRFAAHGRIGQRAVFTGAWW